MKTMLKQHKILIKSAFPQAKRPAKGRDGMCTQKAGERSGI